MRGYPAWPAEVVEQRHGGKYTVTFFGTLETANVNPTDIWPYDTAHTSKFCTEKNLARPLFMEGMEQMKQALAKAGSKGENPVNSMDQEEADMAKVGRRKSKEAADEFLDSSKCRLKKKDTKRKSGGNDVEMKGAYRSPRVFGDKFGDKFSEQFGDSLNFVINLVILLVTYFVSHQVCHNFW